MAGKKNTPANWKRSDSSQEWDHPAASKENPMELRAWCMGMISPFEGSPEVLKKVAEDLRKVWIIQVRATLDPEPGDDKEVSILYRIVRWCDDCLLYEADPRHVEKLLREAGLASCKSVTTPGVKEASDVTSTAWFEESGLSPES